MAGQAASFFSTPPAWLRKGNFKEWQEWDGTLQGYLGLDNFLFAEIYLGKVMINGKGLLDWQYERISLDAMRLKRGD